MDQVGWHALRAAKEEQDQPFEQNPDGSYQPRVSVAPMNDAAPSPPPKDESYKRSYGSLSPIRTSDATDAGKSSTKGPSPASPTKKASKPFPKLSVQGSELPAYQAPPNHPAPWMPDGKGGPEEKQLLREQQKRARAPTMSAVERSNAYGRVARMNPHLQFLCGPLLRYDTVENGIWYGAALIVTADAGSIYEPHPKLTLEYDPSNPLQTTTSLNTPVQSSRAPSNPAVYHSPISSAAAMSSPSLASHPSNFYGGSSSFRETIPPPLPGSPPQPSPSHVPSSSVSTTGGSQLQNGLAASPPQTQGLTAVPTSPTRQSRVSTSSSVSANTSKIPGTPMSSTLKRQDIPGDELWVYNGPYGTCTFWRMMFSIPLSETSEMQVTYRINGGHGMSFYVPAKGAEMRWAAYSCNGFSAGINADDFKGPGHASGFDPVWTDLLEKHAEKPFHVLVGGGDQLYCDSLMREPELQEFVSLKNGKDKVTYKVSDALRLAVDRFYFSHYCLVFRNGKFAQANSSIPMANMLDDHDMIDGFGSYPEDLQRSEIFQLIGDRAYHFFLLFQCFTTDDVDGIDPTPGAHKFRSMLIGGPGPYIPYPSHSMFTYLGPSTYMVMLDCRAERTLQRVCSELSYRRMFDRLWALPETVRHVIIQLGIPIAYPRMNFLETALESSYNPFVALAKLDKLGLGTMVNKFNKDAELLDDLMDHWTAKTHKKERNWFIEQLQNFALLRRIRVTFLSGDVHCAAVGVLKTLKHNGSGIGHTHSHPDPELDHRYMLNVVTSAIVNTPPPNGVHSMVSSLSERVHKTLHHNLTDESMIPLFKIDTDGKPSKSKNIMARRNYTIVDYDSKTDELQFDIRVEKSKGVGTTIGYAVRSPKPGWES